MGGKVLRINSATIALTTFILAWLNTQAFASSNVSSDTLKSQVLVHSLQPKFHVTFRGNTVFTISQLEKVAEPFEKNSLNMTTLTKIKNAVTEFYKNHGYVTSFATLPPQNIHKGVVIQVNEGRIIKGTLVNKGRVSTNFVHEILAPDASGKIFNVSQLDSNMSTLAAVAPGATSFLSAGSKPMTSNLTVNIPPQNLYSGNISVNDYGMPYTGTITLQSNNTFNNLAHHGDALTLNVSSSVGYNSVQAGYNIAINEEGGSVGVGYSADNYTVGQGFNLFSYQTAPSVFAALGLSGYGQTFSAFYTQPVIHSSSGSLSFGTTYSHSIQSDTYDVAAGVADDRNIDAFTLNSNFQNNDTFLGGGTDSGNLALTLYFLSTFGAGSNGLNPYGISTPGRHAFLKWFFSRTNMLPGVGNSVALSTSGLYSGGDGALDPMEEFSLGGEGTLRGFATATLFGFNAIDVNLEFRHVFTAVKTGQLMATAFYDFGGIQLEPAASFSSAGTVASTAAPFVTLMSPGIGVKYNYKALDANLEAGMPMGNLPQQVPNQPFGQLWFSVGLHY